MAATSDFGSDLSCLLDIDPEMRVVTGRRLLVEAIVRRLMTPRGRLIGAPEYGIDITEMLNDDLTPREIAAWQGSIAAECRKDERIEDARCKITPPPGGDGAYKIRIMLVDADGPFDFTFNLTDEAKVEDLLLAEAA